MESAFMCVLKLKIKSVLKYLKEFLRLCKLGFSPLKLIFLSLKNSYWVNVILSGNADLYLSIE